MNQPLDLSRFGSIHFTPGVNSAQRELRNERMLAVVAAREAGAAFQDIATALGVSKPRAHEIYDQAVKKFGLNRVSIRSKSQVMSALRAEAAATEDAEWVAATKQMLLDVYKVKTMRDSFSFGSSIVKFGTFGFEHPNKTQQIITIRHSIHDPAHAARAISVALQAGSKLPGPDKSIAFGASFIEVSSQEWALTVRLPHLSLSLFKVVKSAPSYCIDTLKYLEFEEPEAFVVEGVRFICSHPQMGPQFTEFFTCRLKDGACEFQRML